MWILEAFAVTLLSDCVFTLYLRRVGQGRAIWAGIYSAGIYAISGIITLLYVSHGAEAIVPVALGAFWGTWLTIRLDTRRHSVTPQR